MSELRERLVELRKAAMAQHVSTGPDPVYEPTVDAEAAYYEWMRTAWLNADAIIAALNATDAARPFGSSLHGAPGSDLQAAINAFDAALKGH